MNPRISTLSIVLALSACSTLADEDTGAPPLATIKGRLTLENGTTVPDETLRVALLWDTPAAHEIVREYAPNCGPPGLFAQHAQQQVEIEPTFPNEFVLNLTGPPPAESLQPFSEEPSIVTSIGRIVVYSDGNENGILDGSTESGLSPDRLLASSYRDRLRRIEQDEVSESQVSYFSASHHYEHDGVPYDVVAGYSLGLSRLDGGGEVVAIDTPIDLHLTSAPDLQQLLCSEYCMQGPEVECPASPADLESAPDGSRYLGDAAHQVWTWSEGPNGYTTLGANCDDQPGYFYWSLMRCEGCTCWASSCSYEQASVPAADWPCD